MIGGGGCILSASSSSSPAKIAPPIPTADCPPTRRSDDRLRALNVPTGIVPLIDSIWPLKLVTDSFRLGPMVNTFVLERQC